MKLFTEGVKEMTREKFAETEMVSFTPRSCTLKNLGQLCRPWGPYLQACNWHTNSRNAPAGSSGLCNVRRLLARLALQLRGWTRLRAWVFSPAAMPQLSSQVDALPRSVPLRL